MMKPSLNRTFVLRSLGALVGAAVIIGQAATPARAIDDEDLPDIKFLQGVLKSLGLRKDTNTDDYRERSPLVVPPSRNLPPPKSVTKLDTNPAWPKDPEIAKRKSERAERNAPGRMVDDASERMRPLRPNEVRTNGAPVSAASKNPGDNRVIDYSAPMKPNELGYKGGLFSSILKPQEEEFGTFTGETPRASLIEPPAGYRTPSPTQPYGAGKEKWTPTPVDRLLPTR
jgi:hypothetical protein